MTPRKWSVSRAAIAGVMSGLIVLAFSPDSTLILLLNGDWVPKSMARIVGYVLGGGALGAMIAAFRNWVVVAE